MFILDGTVSLVNQLKFLQASRFYQTQTAFWEHEMQSIRSTTSRKPNYKQSKDNSFNEPRLEESCSAIPIVDSSFLINLFLIDLFLLTLFNYKQFDKYTRSLLVLLFVDQELEES